MRDESKAIIPRDSGRKIPNYYVLPNGIECKDVEGEFPTNKGKAIGYIWRSGKKPGVDEISDLKKAIDHLTFEIERLSK